MRKGRKYVAKGKYEYWITPDGLLKLKSYAREGLSDEEIAKKLDISRSTLGEWKNRYPEIQEALREGKEIPDIQVEDKLLDSALGFKVTLKKPVKIKRIEYDNGKKIKEYEEVIDAEEEIYVPPAVAAQIFWLKNRRPDKWREKVLFEDGSSLEKLDEIIKEIGGVVGERKE